MTKPEYLTYVSLYMAGIDTHTTGKELAFIKARFGEKTYQEIKSRFDVANEAERINVLKNSAESLNIDKEALQTELKYLSRTDGEVSSNENYLINFIVRLLD